MVQAIINLGEHENRVVNIVKGKFGLHNKSEAISLIIQKFESEILEPELKPEFIERIRKRSNEGTVKVKDFRNHFELK